MQLLREDSDCDTTKIYEGTGCVDGQCAGWDGSPAVDWTAPHGAAQWKASRSSEDQACLAGKELRHRQLCTWLLADTTGTAVSTTMNAQLTPPSRRWTTNRRRVRRRPERQHPGCDLQNEDMCVGGNCSALQTDADVVKTNSARSTNSTSTLMTMKKLTSYHSSGASPPGAGADCLSQVTCGDGMRCDPYEVGNYMDDGNGGEC